MYLYTNQPYEYYAIDIETDDLNATRIWCAVIQEIKEDGKIFTFRPNEMQELRDFINTKNKKPTTKWVGHNALSFDIPTINRLLGTNICLDSVVDTLTLSYLYWPHIPRPRDAKGKLGPHSLKAWGLRLGLHKGDYNDWSHFNEEMLEYCIQDVAVTVALYNYLFKEMRKIGFSELSCEIEHDIRKIIDIQQATGVAFKEREAEILLAGFRSSRATLEENILSVFRPELKLKGTYNYRVRRNGTPYASYFRHRNEADEIRFNRKRTKYQVWNYEDFNIGSPKQRVERLLSLGWKPTEFTPLTPKGGGGNPKITEDSLEAFSKESGIKEVSMISEWMTLNNRISSLEEWLSHCVDGRIHGRVLTCGAGTRRMRHMKPNTANICGTDKPYGEEMRSLWVTGIGIDAKGLEGRTLLHYLNNSAATELFMSGDVHQMNADACTEAVGFEVTRRTAKTLYYAVLYGASDTKLGKIVGHNRKVGGLIREAILSAVPGLKDLTDEIQKEFHENNGFLKTIDGGYVRCLSPHAALNYKCQSAGGILMKLATNLSWPLIDHSKAKKVLDVHDEVQFELIDPSYTEEVGKIYCDCITEAGKILGFSLEMEGDYIVGPTWKETH